MYQYIAKRIVLSVITLFFVSAMTFSMTQILPGDAARLILGIEATPERVETVRQNLGLNRPLYIQYLDWVIGFLTGDLGTSFHYGEPVSKMINNRLPRSIYLAGAAMFIAIATAIPLGVISAVRQNKIADITISTFTFAGISVPNFFWGLVFILVFARYLNILPPSGYVDPNTDAIEFLKRIIMPAAALAWSQMAYITRMVRSSMLEVFQKDYIRTAKMKGAPWKTIIYKHSLRNALIPALTVIAFQIGYAFGGIIILEEIFSWPGIGSLAFTAILERDLPVIQAAVMYIAFVFIAANFIADILYSVLDPRIRYGGENS